VSSPRNVLTGVSLTNRRSSPRSPRGSATEIPITPSPNGASQPAMPASSSKACTLRYDRIAPLALGRGRAQSYASQSFQRLSCAFAQLFVSFPGSHASMAFEGRRPGGACLKARRRSVAGHEAFSAPGSFRLPGWLSKAGLTLSRSDGRLRTRSTGSVVRDTPEAFAGVDRLANDLRSPFRTHRGWTSGLGYDGDFAILADISEIVNLFHIFP
jgi:hypothetical protein